jgi:hypothetical protein
MKMPRVILIHNQKIVESNEGKIEVESKLGAVPPVNLFKNEK